jgi:hypothetical protein
MPVAVNFLHDLCALLSVVSTPRFDPRSFFWRLDGILGFFHRLCIKLHKNPAVQQGEQEAEKGFGQ